MPVHVTLTINCPANSFASGHTVRLHFSASLAVKLEPSLQLVVQLLSLVRLFVTPWTATGQASLSFTISWSLLKLMSTESMMPSNHLILLPPSLPALPPLLCSSPRLFSSKSLLTFSLPPASLPSTTSGGHLHPFPGRQPPAGHASHSTRGICR